MGHELNDTDKDILKLMLDGRDAGKPWGRTAPTLLADELDLSRQYVGLRFQLLEAANLVHSLGAGIRELTDEGIEVAEDLRNQG